MTNRKRPTTRKRPFRATLLFHPLANTNSDGYLTALTNPNIETRQYTYTPDGIMTTQTGTPSPPDECEACSGT